MKKILITGSSGYVGSHLCQLLNRETDYEIFGLDLNPPVIKIKNFQYIDITRNFCCFINTVFDCVIHLAAKVSVSESVKNPELYYKTNILGTINVLNNIKYKNFILASTGGVTHLSNPYSLSKKAAEDLVNNICENFTIFRFYNVIGFENIMPTNIDGLFLNLINAVNTKIFHLYGDDYCTPDGSCIRDYIHVNEVCHAIIRAIERSSNQIENLGRGHGYSVLEIIKIFKQVNNLDFDVVVCPKREGDIVSNVLKEISSYMQTNYSIEEILKIK